MKKLVFAAVLVLTPDPQRLAIYDKLYEKILARL
jgi:hypothetical protein